MGEKVTLADGREVDSWSAEWREECARLEQEAQRIAQLPSFEQRKSAVGIVRATHGEQYATRLTDRLVQLRQARIEKARAA